MGFDLSGQSGNYFRNNVWYWRPLWQYIVQTCDIPEKTAGYYNDGVLVGKKTCERIVRVIEALLEDNLVDIYAKEYKRRQDVLPDETCTYCKGEGIRKGVQGLCNGCRGKGTVRPWSTQYPFTVENVREFVSFVKDSDGFRIY